jgi:hypothetical protein
MEPPQGKAGRFRKELARDGNQRRRNLAAECPGEHDVVDCTSRHLSPLRASCNCREVHGINAKCKEVTRSGASDSDGLGDGKAQLTRWAY